MRKTVVVLLTSLLLASLPVQADHEGYPGETVEGEDPGTTVPKPGEEVERVVHDCTGDRDASEPGNDLASVWVGTGMRDVDPDPDVEEMLRVVLVDVVFRPRDPARANDVPARISVSMEANNNVRQTVLEWPSDAPTTPDWQDADAIVYLSGPSNLEPLTIATRDVMGTQADPVPHRALELGYRFADIFAPGSEAPPAQLVIEGKWDVQSFFLGAEGFEEADVMPGEDTGCDDYLNEPSGVLVPPPPVVHDVTATWPGDPADEPGEPDEGTADAVNRKPDTKVTFRADVSVGGGDPGLAGYTYKWTFFNGDEVVEATGPEPEVRFTELAEVTDATLTVKDDLGVESAEYRYSDANERPLVTFENLPPVADFRMGGTPPVIPVAGQPVTFQDLSFDEEGDDVTAWSWDFGDGSDPVTTRNPSHTFAAVGTYDVRLTATEEHGATDDHVLRVFVCEEAGDDGCKPPNSAPQVSFLPSATQVTRGETVTFTDTSTDRDGTIASWSWDFGDGGTSDQQDPEHTFEEVGTFHVTLTATDDGGLEGTRAIAVRVTLPEPEDDPDDAELLPAPLASFTVDPEEPVEGEEVRFRDATSSQTEITRWTWFFGDGSDVAEGRDVSHTYEESGTFRVRLTVTDERGVRDTTTQTVVVGAAEPEEDAPGLPLVLLLAGLAGAAVVARRRH